VATELEKLIGGDLKGGALGKVLITGGGKGLVWNEWNERGYKRDASYNLLRQGTLLEDEAECTTWVEKEEEGLGCSSPLTKKERRNEEKATGESRLHDLSYGPLLSCRRGGQRDKSGFLTSTAEGGCGSSEEGEGASSIDSQT